MATWTNKDGLAVNFGLDRTTVAKVGTQGNQGNDNRIVVKYTAGDPPDATDIAFGGQAFIPAGSTITRAVMLVDTAFAGGTSIDIGLYQSDGTTAIDADGIDDDIALSAINATSKSVQCDGALVGSAVNTAADGYVVITETGTFTAGEATILIDYVKHA